MEPQLEKPGGRQNFRILTFFLFVEVQANLNFSEEQQYGDAKNQVHRAGVLQDDKEALLSKDTRIMTSAFAAQLGQIAATSTNELNLKAQKAAHSLSLIFERKVAGSQDFETIYQICFEGFQDLCQLDQRFLDFQRNVFNVQSKDQDRMQMTAQENEALDSVLEQFLSLIGSRILLRPAVKALEWLIRRFKVHTYNTSYLVSTFLPYHETPIFKNLLSILPAELPVEYKFLGPYLKTATNPPRHAIAYSATSSDQFLTTLCSYTLKTCQEDTAYPLLLAFWTSVVTEAVAGRLTLAQSGRREVQQQRQEDVLLKVLPLLSEGLTMQDVPEMILACYTIAVILANKINLSGDVIDSLMESIAISLSARNVHSGLVCLSILAERKKTSMASRKLLGLMIQRTDFVENIQSVDQSYSVSGLVQALTRRALQGLKKKNYETWLQFVDNATANIKWRPEHVHLFFEDILQAIANLEDKDAVSPAIKARLLDLLRRLCYSRNSATVLRQSAGKLGMSQTDLESLLGQVLENATDQTKMLEVAEAMEIDDQPSPENALEAAFKHVPERTVDDRSFLTTTDPLLFQQLLHAFQVSCRQRNGNIKFRALSIWRMSSRDGSFLYVSFLLRVLCGPYPELSRIAALRAITQEIENQGEHLDSQALLFYILPRLADPSPSLRQAASEVLISMHSKCPEDLSEEEECRRWGADDLYGIGSTDTVKWFSASDLRIVLRDGFLPALEESVADPDYINKRVQKVFLGGVVNSKAGRQHGSPDFKDLKKALRHSLFESLISHIVSTPFLAAKIDMINLVQVVDKVGTTSRSRYIRSAVQEWALLSIEDATRTASRERLEVSYVDNGMLKFISPSDQDAAALLMDLIIDMKQTPRSSFIDSVFGRLREIWSKLLPDTRAAGAQKLIHLALSTSVFSAKARDVLSSLDLPGDALSRVLHATFSGNQHLQDATPTRKRRRSSSGNKPSSTALNSMASHMTLALELIDSSKPEQHQELLLGLFEALGVLQNLKRLSQQDFPYLLHLCLSSILGIVRKVGPSPKVKRNLASVRIELVTDCIRQSDNAQVQNTAILLSAELARIVPEKILHNAMPIFTFLGGHALAKDDEYSVFVVNRAIDQILPPLIQTLQTQRKDMVAAVSDLLSSFCAAFEHIASHRRLGLFQKLISKLGPDSILNTLVAMLMLRNSTNADTGVFITILMSSFPIEVQLQTLHDLLNQMVQISQGNSEVTKMLTTSDFVDTGAGIITLRTLLVAVERVMKATNLLAGLKNLQNRGEEANAALESQILGTMKHLMQLARNTAEDEELNAAVEQCTNALLNLVPLPELLHISAHILRSNDTKWHQDTLLVLEARLSIAATRDSRSRVAALTMLPILTAMINDEAHDGVKHGAIRCIDRISELYGRRDPAAVVQAATLLSTSSSMNSEKPALQTITLLCLASMLDCAREAMIPVVPNIMSLSTAVLKESLTEDAEDDRLHNAAYALVSAIISNLSFMLSEDDLDSIMKLSAESANAELGQASHAARGDALSLLTRKVDIGKMVSTLQRTWSVAIENGVEATDQALDALSNSFKRATKASIAAVADQISDLFTQMLDLRRVQFTQRDEDSYSDEEVSAVEAKVNQVAIEFIYKLNDMMFRPILLQWIEWAVKCNGISSARLDRAKMYRQASMFNFLAHFFGTLKSIVTSYANHVLKPAVTALQLSASLAGSTVGATKALDVDQQMLWVTTCDMVAEACKYDQDAFFSSPSHFPQLADVLVAQLKLASERSLQPDILAHVIPAIVALAFATADTVSHLKVINHRICQLRHSEAVGVRMASIQAQHALVESEDVGEEWVSSVVQGGGETMVYVSEMLEDDDEDVEREVRKWARIVREKVGEDLFEE